MEQKIQINTEDNHIIYGTLNALPGNDGTLIIFVHGLSGNQHEHHYFNAVPFFNKKGFGVFRFDFYCRKPKARSLSESTITMHAEDLELIIKHFRGKFRKIILIGHSLGALAILNADLSGISKIVLWDPTTGFKDIKEKNASFNAGLDKYILHWGKDILLGKQMIEEWKDSDLNDLVDRLTVPCKFIFAGGSGKYGQWEPFLEKLRVENKIAIVQGATHRFCEEGTEQELFEETYKWIK